MVPSSPSTTLTSEELSSLFLPDSISPFVLGHRLYMAIEQVDQEADCAWQSLFSTEMDYKGHHLMADRQAVRNATGGRGSV